MSIRRSLAASVVGRYAGMVIQLISSVVLARLLTPADFGLFGVALATIWIVGVVREFGATNYLIQLPRLERADIGRAVGLVVAISGTGALGLFLARGWIADYYREPLLADLIGLSLLGFMVAPLGIGASAALQREMRFVALNVIHVIALVVGSLVGVVLAWRGHGAFSLVWSQLVSNMLSTVLLAAVRPRDMLCLPRFDKWGTMFSFGFYSTLGGLAWQFNSFVLTLMLGKSLGFASLGVFDRANGTLQYLGRDLMNAISQVAYVGLAKAKENPSHMNWFAGRAITNIVGVLWPAYATLAALADPFVVTLFGEQWRPAVPLVQIMAISGAGGALVMIHARVLTVRGQAGRLCAVDWIAQGVRLAAVAVGLLLWPTLLTVAWASVLATVINVVLYLAAGYREANVSLREILRICGHAFLLSVVTALPPWLLITFGPPLGHLGTLVAGGGLAGVGWLAFGRLTRHAVAAEALNAASAGIAMTRRYSKRFTLS